MVDPVMTLLFLDRGGRCLEPLGRRVLNGHSIFSQNETKEMTPASGAMSAGSLKELLRVGCYCTIEDASGLS